MRNEKRRLQALMNIIQPRDSMVAKLETLSSEQRKAYSDWQDRLKKWHCDHPGEQAYSRLIEDDPGPMLRWDISEVLFGSTTSIPANASGAQAADAYARMLGS